VTPCDEGEKVKNGPKTRDVIYGRPLTLLRPSVTSSLEFAHRSIAIAFGTNSRQLGDNYLTHPTNSPKPHLLLSLHSFFTPNLKHCSSTNPILIHSLLPTSPHFSTPNTIYHSHLTVCLPDSLDLTRCLSILFWTAP